MDLFERITNQMLVECEDGNVEWHQSWYNVIPDDAEEPCRPIEVQECYDLAMRICHEYVSRAGVALYCTGEHKFATYNFDADEVTCPCRLQFDCDADFFSTLFHELVHSTGCSKRLNRPGFNVDRSMGEYNEEELVAELGSLFLLGVCCYNGGKAFEQSVAYIRHYKNATNTTDEDLKLIAKQALQAVDLILGE